MNDAVLAINSSIGQRASEQVAGLEAKVKASMLAVIKGNWMAMGDDALFRAGIGGALLDVGTDSEDGQRLVASVEALRKFSAFLAAAQAGLDVSPENILPNDETEILPLMKWWNEVKTTT